MQNVEERSQHEEEGKDETASRGAEEDAETVPAEGDVISREGCGRAAGPLRDFRRTGDEGQLETSHHHQ